MPDLFYLISKWWKQILLVVLISTAIATTIVLLQPRKYLATATALAASPFGNDRSRIFNDNIEALYPTIGTADELDVILSTAQLDTVYIALAEQFDLGNHYRMGEKGGAAIRKAAYLLKADTRIRKGDYGELKVRIWHEEKELAPQLANGFVEKLQSIHQDIQNVANISALRSLEEGTRKLRAKLDSLDNGQDAYAMQRTVLEGQLQQYGILANEFNLVIESKPPALIVVEPARMTEWPDKPRRLLVIVSTLVLSFLFSLFIVLVLEKRKPSTP
jgi:uncharacterized protein involved in exopolysaccharide biosynthesis